MLGSTIQRELAMMIQRDLNDPRLPPTAVTSITHVKISPDLSIADVYVTIMRTKLTKALTLRAAPFLKFHFDENLKKELNIMNLLDQVAKENAEIDRKRAEAAASNEQPTTDNQPSP
jgi:ribosome-binding factor A